MTTPRAQFFYKLARFLPAIPFLLGVNGLFRPESGLAVFEFPAPATPEAKKLTYNLIRIYASRNVVIGLLTFAVSLRGDRKLMGWMIPICTISGIVDGFVSLDQIGTGAFNHWPLVPIALLVWAGMEGLLG
ncbi:hypothetical protein GQ53DRAFT_820923 [Thozetella sp. PMI_491]|nr:hypothetical protein GQ53DRAFT_820923 [Thozetella sp. PMI_491]